MVTIYDSLGSKSFYAFIIRSISEFKIFRFALFNCVITELEQRYRRSLLGFLWTLLNPLMTMAITAMVFSLIWRMSLKNFAVYLFSGLVPYSYMMTSITRAGESIIYSESFLKKVYVPKFFFPLVAVSSETINFSFSLISLFILGIFLGIKISWALIFLPAAIIILFILNLGLSLILSVASVYFRDLNHIVKVFFSALYFLLPIIYPMDFIPQQYRHYFLYNPFYYFINLFRRIIYDGVAPTAIEWITPIIIATLCLILGHYVLMRKEKDIIYRL